MAKSRTFIRVVAGIAGAVVVGTFAYAFKRQAQRAGRVRTEHAQASPVSSHRPGLLESMVVPRSSVPDPLTLVLDLDGVFRGDAVVEPTEATVQCQVKLPSPASPDDGEPPEVDSLGAYWLARATQSERSLHQGDLDIDLDNVADIRDEDAPGEDEDEDGRDSVLERGLLAAGGWPRG